MTCSFFCALRRRNNLQVEVEVDEFVRLNKTSLSKCSLMMCTKVVRNQMATILF